MGAITFGHPLSPSSSQLACCQHHQPRFHHSRLQSSLSTTCAVLQHPTEEPRDDTRLTKRRNLLLPLTAGAVSGVLSRGLTPFSPPSLAEDGSSLPDYTVTEKVFLEITKCPSISITSRDSGLGTQGAISSSSTYSYALPLWSQTLTAQALPPLQASNASSSSPSPSPSYCNDSERLGRIVIGLYGKQVPVTAAHFKAMCTGKAGSSYKGSIFHRIISGQYIMAGKQGFSKEKGEVSPPSKLDQNKETIKSEAFRLPHLKPGTVSLCLSENDDEDQFKLNTDYRNVEFLITTGPGPAPQLNNRNIVFGTVLEGLDVVRAAAVVPTYKPSEKIRQFNEFAAFLGDERASNARSIWNRPLKALYISDCGEL